MSFRKGVLPLFRKIFTSLSMGWMEIKHWSNISSTFRISKLYPVSSFNLYLCHCCVHDRNSWCTVIVYYISLSTLDRAWPTQERTRHGTANIHSMPVCESRKTRQQFSSLSEQVCDCWLFLHRPIQSFDLHEVSSLWVQTTPPCECDEIVKCM